MRSGKVTLALITASFTTLAGPACYAEIAVSANDGKMVLEDGVAKVRKDPLPDTVSILDLSGGAARIIAELPAPASVVGPPASVAIAPDESFALVTGAMKVDPADPTKSIPDDKLTVIDLKSSPPKVLTTLQAGAGAAGVSINRAATLALVANRSEGTVSVFTISGNTLTPAGKIPLGDAKSGPSHPIFSRDGATALVTRDGDNRISVLSVDGNKVEYTKRDLSAGLRPYQIDSTGNGDVAIVGNIGTGSGDADSISLIDMRAKPIRVASTVSVGQTPEGLKMSPDGATFYVADMESDGVWLVDGPTLRVRRFLHTGQGAHGLYVTRDSRHLLITNRGEGSISVLDFATNKLVDRWRIPGGGSPDMGGLSSNGKVFWVSGRYDAEVYAISTVDGHLIRRIPVGSGPHGLCVYPQPGRYSLGHTCVFR